MSRHERKSIPAIVLENISKKYVLHHEKPTFVEQIIKRQKREVFTALDNISVRIEKGEKVGIIGRNGAGKTTLLKIISGITTPTQGIVKTNGKVVSLIDLEAGFHPELTGEENIFLNGLVLGMNRSEIRQNYDEIISFADIGSFIDAPLYTFSAGMKLRLGFSVAVHANPDILILDESLVVGDVDFQKKSRNKIEEFFSMNKTILIVSHLLEFLEDQVNRVILIDNHRVVMDGPASKVIQDYKEL